MLSGLWLSFLGAMNLWALYGMVLSLLNRITRNGTSWLINFEIPLLLVATHQFTSCGWNEGNTLCGSIYQRYVHKFFAWCIWIAEDISISKTPEVDLIHSDTTQVAWVLSPNAIDQPLLILSRASLIWIYNPVSKGLSSYLRGHGGVRFSSEFCEAPFWQLRQAITSLAVHPTRPHLFCSTSRDHSARIYDLNLAPHQGAKDSDVNPHWPPGTLPSRAGAPHGLHMNEAEGFGIARCIIVLMGGRSGGHEAAVLSAVRISRFCLCYANLIWWYVIEFPSTISHHRNMWSKFISSDLLLPSSLQPRLTVALNFGMLTRATPPKSRGKTSPCSAAVVSIVHGFCLSNGCRTIPLYRIIRQRSFVPIQLMKTIRILIWCQEKLLFGPG